MNPLNQSVDFGQVRSPLNLQPPGTGNAQNRLKQSLNVTSDLYDQNMAYPTQKPGAKYNDMSFLARKQELDPSINL